MNLRDKLKFWMALSNYVDMIVRGTSPLSLPDAIANSLSYVKAFGGTEQRNLPDGYIQRQFIYMMDGSYLLTDIVPTYDGHYEMDFQTTTVSSGVKTYIGGRTASHPAGLRFGTDSSNRFTLGAFDYSYTTSTSPSNNTRYKFVYNNQRVSLTSNGTTIFDVTSTDTSATGAELAINALNNNGTIVSGNAEIYLYSFKAWNGQGELVMDLVPAVQKDTVPVVGFYDTVSGTFKTATAGTFAAGGEAVPTPDTPMDIVSNNGVLKVNTNLLDTSTDTPDKFINDSGVISDNTGSFYSALIPAKPNTNYTFVKDSNGGAYMRIHSYDSSGNWLAMAGKSDTTSDITVSGTTTATTAFIRVCGKVSSNMQVYLTDYAYGSIYTDGTAETIDVHGTNIFNKNDTASINNLYSASSKIAVSGSNQTLVMRAKPGATYYYKHCSVSGGGRAFYTEVEDWDVGSDCSPMFGTVIADKNEVGSITVSENAKWVFFNYGRSGQTATFEEQLADYMVSLTPLTSDTQYVPYYDGGTATAEMLLKVGDYQDVQSIIDGVVTRNVGVKVLDGTETWSYSASYSRFVTNIPDMPSAISRSLPFISTHYQGIQSATTAPGYIYNSSNRQIMITDAHTSVEDWQQWLADQYAAGHPVIVLYPLDEPTTESVAGQTMQVTDDDNVLEITQASLNNLELEAKYESRS